MELQSRLQSRRRLTNWLVMGLSVVATGFGLLWLALVLGTLLVNGIGAISPALFIQMTPPPGSSGGPRRAEMEGDPDGHLPGGGAGDRHRRAARDSQDFRRDRAAVVHRAEQSVLEHRSEPPDGQSAGRYLPVCAEPVCGLAGAR